MPSGGGASGSKNVTVRSQTYVMWNSVMALPFGAWLIAGTAALLLGLLAALAVVCLARLALFARAALAGGVGLYLNPPDAAAVLCVDERSQIQTLDPYHSDSASCPGAARVRSSGVDREGGW
jgi:hypothetical protein